MSVRDLILLLCTLMPGVLLLISTPLQDSFPHAIRQSPHSSMQNREYWNSKRGPRNYSPPPRPCGTKRKISPALNSQTCNSRVVKYCADKTSPRFVNDQSIYCCNVPAGPLNLKLSSRKLSHFSDIWRTLGALINFSLGTKMTRLGKAGLGLFYCLNTLKIQRFAEPHSPSPPPPPRRHPVSDPRDNSDPSSRCMWMWMC